MKDFEPVALSELYQRAKRGDAEALDLLYMVTRGLVAEKQRRSSKQGRKIDKTKHDFIKLAALQTCRDHLRKYGEIRRRNLVADTITAIEISEWSLEEWKEGMHESRRRPYGLSADRKTVKRVIDQWYPLLERLAEK